MMRVQNTTKKLGHISISILAVLIIVAILILPVSAADDRYTIVSMNVAELQIEVDENIQEWGYLVSTDPVPRAFHYESSYRTQVNSGQKVQISVGGENGIPAGWYLKTSIGYVEEDHNNLVTIEEVTGIMTVRISALKRVANSGVNAVSMCLVHFDTFTEQVIEDQWLKEGSLVQMPEDPVNEGFVFSGWYTEEGREWNFASDKVYYSMTLYAKWVYQDNPVIPVEPVTPVATPFPVPGILAGLGAAAFFLRRR